MSVECDIKDVASHAIMIEASSDHLLDTNLASRSVGIRWRLVILITASLALLAVATGSLWNFPGHLRLAQFGDELAKSWQIPKAIGDMAIRPLDSFLEEKVLPELNRELPGLIRDSGSDPLDLLGSGTGSLQLRNLSGLSSLQLNAVRAKPVSLFEAELDIRAEMTSDLTANGEMIPPEALSKMISRLSNSITQKTNPWWMTPMELKSNAETLLEEAKTLPFTITFQGVRMEHGVAYIMSNNFTAVDGIEVQQTPIVYKRLDVDCHSGFLGSSYSPARIMCTQTALKMAALKKDWIQTKLSEKVRELLQSEFDNMLPGRLPKEKYDRRSSFATLIAGALLISCCCCFFITLRHRRIKIYRPLPEDPEQDLAESTPAESAPAE